MAHSDGPAPVLDRSDHEKDLIVQANQESWGLYAGPISEFLRQGVDLDKSGKTEFSKKALFKVYHNKLYLLCSTYPDYLVFPA